MLQTIVIAGPTGSGKSALAMRLAEAWNGEIIGCDSVQLYRGFDIGSAKPSEGERRRVTHHLVDVLDWHEEFDAARYAESARRTIEQVLSRGHTPIVVGGTGLYLRALLGENFHHDLPKDERLRAALRTQDSAELYARLQGLDPHRAAALHPNDRFRVIRALELISLLGHPVEELAARAPQRPALDSLLVVLDPPRAALHERIAQRTESMLDEGLVSEVEALLAKRVDPGCKPMQSIGYKQCVAYIAKSLPVGKSLRQCILEATRQYAKRQITWFKKMPATVRPQDVDQAFAALASLRTPT